MHARTHIHRSDPQKPGERGTTDRPVGECAIMPGRLGLQASSVRDGLLAGEPNIPIPSQSPTRRVHKACERAHPGSQYVPSAPGTRVSEFGHGDVEGWIRTGTALRAVEREASRLGAGRPARGASVVLGLTAREAAGDATERPRSGSPTAQVGSQSTLEQEESREDEESEGARVGHGCGVPTLGGYR